MAEDTDTNSIAQAGDDDGKDGDKRGDVGALTAVLEKLTEGEKERDAKLDALLEKIVAAKPASPDDDIDNAGTPTKRTETVDNIRIYDRFDQLNYSRGDYEFAMMIFHGTHQIVRATSLTPPDDLVRAWQHHVFEAPADPLGPDGKSMKPIGKRNYGGRIWIGDGNGEAVREMDPQRAMDTAESGFGLELMGTQYARDLWEAARNLDSIVGSIREIPVSENSMVVPIDGDLPEMHFVGESVAENASNLPTSKTASGKRTLDPKKFTIHQIWSGELEEDSIIAFTPFLREMLNMSAAQHLGSSYYNGDAETGGTGNINKDDGAPGSTKHYLAYDGIRNFWLVDNTAQGKDMAAALDTREINVARGKLNAGDDDIDNLIKNINWGLNPRDLRLVCDWDTYMALLDADSVTTVDKYGPQATILTGELGSFKGIPIIVPAYASKTEADGKASDTEGNNTKGQITIFAPAAWLAGNRRGVQLFFDRIQRTDQFLFELYTRRAFINHGANAAAGIFNISL